jgi:hypothetical protein
MEAAAARAAEMHRHRVKDKLIFKVPAKQRKPRKTIRQSNPSTSNNKTTTSQPCKQTAAD